ncbi:hypothetical protein ETD83_12725 [Actinomadura soli]|uniref:Uncharacterized protein n=1 Tax=Actinomadura soli TaxID=2508997 RepID=A0A5C4JG44_9ACTN|nr:hypothetical protein [Actinomadura soli]TMR02402.1 hypothetical protein ETD83_12725 [Actinomadura soli]
MSERDNQRRGRDNAVGQPQTATSGSSAGRDAWLAELVVFLTYPEAYLRKTEKERQQFEEWIHSEIENRFVSREIGAVVVALHWYVESTFGRRGLLDHVCEVEPEKAELVSRKKLSKNLGAGRRGGCGGDVAEAIIRHCADHPASDPDRAARIGRLWVAAYREQPPWSSDDQTVEPADPQEISKLIDPSCWSELTAPGPLAGTAPDPPGEENGAASPSVQLERLQEELSTLQDEKTRAERTVEILQAALGEANADVADLRAKTAAARQTVEELGWRLSQAERQRDNERSEAGRARALVAQHREILAQLLAYLELADVGRSTAEELVSRFAGTTIEAPTAYLMLRQKINTAAPPTRRAFAVYLRVHADLTGNTPTRLADSSGMSAELVERLFTADYVPDSAGALAIAEAVEADPAHTRQLHRFANEDVDYRAIQEEFQRIVARDHVRKRIRNLPATTGKALPRILACFAMCVGATTIVVWIMFPNIFPNDSYLAYASGAKPEMLPRDCSTRRGVCNGFSPDYKWTLEPQQQITTTLKTQNSFSPRTLRGKLATAATSNKCPQAHFTWELSFSGTKATGALSKEKPSRELDQRLAPRPPTIVLTVHRTDNQPCPAGFYWYDAHVTGDSQYVGN